MKPQPKKSTTADPIFTGMSKAEDALLTAYDQIGLSLKAPHLPKRAKAILAKANAALLELLIEVSE